MTGRIKRWWRANRREHEIDDELAFHVETQTQDLMRAGVPPAEARRRALSGFGGLAPIRERTRDARGRRWLTDLVADFRYAARALRQHPGFALVAVLTLTLGIGANTAIFSMVNAVLLRPLPVRDPGRLVLFTGDTSQGTITGPFRGGTWTLFSTETYEFLRSTPLPFQSVAAFESGVYRDGLQVPGSQNQTDTLVNGHFVSGNFFGTMGATAILGRTLTADDDRPGAAPVAVASERFWRRNLDADPQSVGRTILIDARPFVVVGIMPAPFFGVRVGLAPDVWLPLHQRNAQYRERTNNYWLSLVGRLAPGQTMTAAEAATTSALRRFLASQEAAPIDDDTRQRIASVRIAMADGSRGISVTRERNTPLLLLLWSAVGVILLIASANVGTLLLARAASREREVAVRRALGASRSRLIRQWLTESAVLGALGAMCGATVAWFVAPRLLATFVPADNPMTATIDGVVFTFTSVVTLVACLLSGLAPSLRAGRVDPVGSLRLAGRGRPARRVWGMTEPFVVAQVAMSLALVLVATLLVRTLLNAQQHPYGFDQDNVLLVQIHPQFGGYQAATVGELYRRIHDRLETLPGVERVSFARYAPFSGSRSSTSTVVIEGYEPGPGETISLETILVGPNYPQTIGMPLVAGRAFDFADSAGARRVAMVNEAFARRFHPERTPIGRRLALGPNEDRRYEIVGVLKDAHFRNIREAVAPSVFLPMLQEPTNRILNAEFELRAPNAANLAGPVRDAIAAIDPNVRLERTRTLRAQVLATFGPERTAAAFIVTFAGLALVVAAIGLYGVVSHGLARRTSEIGVRLALGAGRVDVVRLVARETLWRLGLGLGIGLLLTQAGSRFLAGHLFGVTPTDLPSAAMAALLLSAVVALTTVRPLLRAMRVDPVIALRAE